MNKLFFFLLFLSACAVVPPQETGKPNQFMDDASFCNVDADCTCGGIDKNTDDCFVGNKLYASKFVDLSQDCPDFCTGIAAHLETRCVDNKCQNVPREGWSKPVACTEEAKLCSDGSAVGRTGPNCEFAPCPGDGVMCTADVKECSDGSFVSRQGPDCEFAPCPSVDLSSAHWLCEDSTWVNNPEDCFDNSCLQKSDCQLMGVSGVCGPYMIAGPTSTLHKPPKFYPQKCGAEFCSEVMAMCIDPSEQPRVMGFDCVENKCVVKYEG